MIHKRQKLRTVKDLPLGSKAQRIVRWTQIESRDHESSLASSIIQTPNAKVKKKSASNTTVTRRILLAMMRAMPQATGKLERVLKKLEGR